MHSILSLSAFLLIAACGSRSAAGSDACPGTAPLICPSCCGVVYAADVCQNGKWSCDESFDPFSCAICDAGTDAGEAADVSADTAPEQ
jgi:hypothetical protein